MDIFSFTQLDLLGTIGQGNAGFRMPAKHLTIKKHQTKKLELLLEFRRTSQPES